MPLCLALLFIALASPFAACANPQSQNIQRLVYALTSAEAQGRAPGSTGHAWALQFLQAELAALGLQAQVQTVADPYPIPIQNLYAKWTGQGRSVKRSCIALVAHYDHVGGSAPHFYPGAMDNAASVAVLLQLAKKLKEKPLALSSDVYFVFPDYEEQNLQGSFYFVPLMRELCAEIKFNITLDVLGAPFFKGMEGEMLVLGSESSKSFSQILPGASETPGLTTHHGPIYLIEPFHIPRSDYANFRSHNIPFVFLTNATPWNYHTPWDTADRLDYEHLQRISDYLYQGLQKFAGKESALAFRYVVKAPSDYAQSAKKLSELIRKYLDKSVANALTPSEIKLFEEDLLLLENPLIGKNQLHKVVIDLLQSVGSKKDIFAPH